MFCKKCGNPLGNAAFCEYCGQHVDQAAQAQQIPQQVPVQQTYTQPAAQPAVEVPAQKRGNVLTGTVGALIGAAIGGASIILLSQIGFVASISGLILAICTVKGYELLGGKLNAPGIVICLLLMAAMPYLADRLDWAIVAARELGDYNITLAEAFQNIPEMIEAGMIEKEDYISNLVMIYLFVGIGAIGTVIGMFKKK